MGTNFKFFANTGTYYAALLLDTLPVNFHALTNKRVSTQVYVTRNILAAPCGFPKKNSLL